jgi:ribosome-binding factor A
MKNLRTYKVSEEIKNVLAGYFISNRLNDPRLNQITITYVKLSKDLQIAYVYFRIYEACEKNIKISLSVLKNASGYFRKILSKDLNLKKTPNLKFFYDQAIENYQNIEYLLSNSKDDFMFGKEMEIK